MHKVIAWIIALLTVAFVGWSMMRLVYGSDGPTTADVARGVQTLQPGADDDRAARLASVFSTAGQRHEIDPLLLVAIAFRESSLSPEVELHRRRGQLGEGGLMQVHGVALTRRPHYCPTPLPDAECQVETGAAWLAEVRETCGGSWWRWVAAYGMARCPSENDARSADSARTAHRYYRRIGGAQWR